MSLAISISRPRDGVWTASSSSSFLLLARGLVRLMGLLPARGPHMVGIANSRHGRDGPLPLHKSRSSWSPEVMSAMRHDRLVLVKCNRQPNLGPAGNASF